MTPCASPVPFETLVGWWTGELPADEAARVEEHVFACDACAEASTRLAKLATGVREHLPPIISREHRDRLEAAGTRIRVTPVEAGVEATAVFGREVDLLVHALHADLAGVERVDVEVLLKGHGEPLLCEAVPFDAASGEVLVCCQRHYQHLSTEDPVFRVFAVEGERRRPLGDYFVRHVWP